MRGERERAASRQLRQPRSGSGSLAAGRWPLAAAAFAIGLASCGGAGSAAEETAPDFVSVGSESVALVAADEIESGPVVSGSLTAENQATVRAETGGTIVQVYAEEGQPVAAGALLARIEGAAAEQAYLSAQAALRAAERTQAAAQRDAERTQRLVEAGALAERDLESARNAVAAAQAELAGARSQLAAAAKQVENTVVRAPIAGIVSERPVNAGDVVTPGAELYTVVDPGGMRLEASVPSDQLGAVRVGAPVSFTVTGYPGRTFAGTVERINPAADPVTRQVPIYVSIPNAGGTLVAGLFAEGRVATSARQTLVVPAAAVDRSGVAPSVVRVRGGVAERVPVRVGIEDAQTERVEIAAGLAAGDTVLLGAAMGTPPGTPVRVAAAE